MNAQNITDIQQRFLNDPEYRIHLVVLNNPEGTADALSENGYLDDQTNRGEDAIYSVINQLLLQQRYEELAAVLAIVPVVPDRLTPDAITALNTLPQLKSDPNPWDSFAGNFSGGDQEGNGFDWGNMDFWGQIHNTVGGLFGIAGGQQQAPPQTVTPPPPAELTTMQRAEMFVKENWPYLVGGLLLAGLAYYLIKRK